MPHILTSEMRRHFHETGALEVEDFFPKKILSEIRQTVADPLPFIERYHKGHDLFRTQELFRRFDMRKDLVQFVSELSQTHIMHLACDQLFDFRLTDGSALLNSPSSFSDLFSLYPLLVAVLVCLEGEGESVKGQPFPSKVGNTTFFYPDTTVDWKHPSLQGRSFFFLAYAPKGATVRFSPTDPHSAQLKRMDYQEGSPIEGRTHPLFRL